MSITVQLTAFILVTIAHIGVAYLLAQTLENPGATNETTALDSGSGANIRDRSE